MCFLIFFNVSNTVKTASALCVFIKSVFTLLFSLFPLYTVLFSFATMFSLYYLPWWLIEWDMQFTSTIPWRGWNQHVPRFRQRGGSQEGAQLLLPCGTDSCCYQAQRHGHQRLRSFARFRVLGILSYV